MSMSYPNHKLCLFPPVLEPILGENIIPKRIAKLCNLKSPAYLRDISGRNAATIADIGVKPLAEYIFQKVQSSTMIGQAEYAITFNTFSFGVPSIFFVTLEPYLSRRTSNALINYNIRDDSDLSKITLQELISIPGLGSRGVLEILTNLHEISEIQEIKTFDFDDKPVKSRKLVKAATKLTNKRWSSKILTSDPRLGKELYSLSNSRITVSAKNASIVLGQEPMNASIAREKTKDIYKFIKLADGLTKLKLKTEMVQIIEAVESRENAQKIIIGRLGADGKEPKTLANIGETLGITRERVRQIENVCFEKLSKLSVWTPVLDKVIRLAETLAPIKEQDFQNELKSQGLIWGTFSVKSIIKISDVLAKNRNFLYDEDRHLIASNDFVELIPTVIQASLRLVSRWGATTIEDVMKEMKLDTADSKRISVIQILEARKDFVWLDKKNGWFWLRNTAKNSVLNAVEKILSVSGSISINDLRNGTGRSNRMQGIRLPKNVLLALCITTGKYEYSDNRLFGGDNLPDWRTLLASGEKIIVSILFENNYVMRRVDLEEQAVKQGLNVNSFYIYIVYSPVLERYAPGVYGLRGAPATAAQVEALAPAKSTRRKTFKDNGWTKNGNLWVGYRVSESVTKSGVVVVPTSLSKYINGTGNWLTFWF